MVVPAPRCVGTAVFLSRQIVVRASVGDDCCVFCCLYGAGVCFLGEKVGGVGNRGYLCGYLWPDEVRAEAECESPVWLRRVAGACLSVRRQTDFAVCALILELQTSCRACKITPNFKTTKNIL